ncbi:MAG: hypothetical protein CL607_28200 [Anaerolineaceae bacterium]|nr:hypothetical protein [Anaerolineaceae bacterium]
MEAGETFDNDTDQDDLDQNPIRILYLDDNKSEHVFVKNVLDKVRNQTYQFVSALGFDEAVNLVRSKPFDICLVDFYLNDIYDRTGVDFVRDMVHDPNVSCPFILLTVVNEREPDIDGMQAGAVAYIEKRHLRPELLERTIRYTIEQYRIRRELEALYTQVRELEAFKASLVRLAGHNLRNHITNVKLSARMLENVVEGSDTAARNLYRINQAVDTMEQLTSDILMLERLNLTNEVIESVINVVDITTDICAQYHNYGLKPGQKLIFNPPNTEFHIRCEKTQLREAIRNLISNASKYSDDKGVITVEISATDQYVSVAVEDNGYGIPEDRQSELFQPFARVLTEETEKIHGTGLGLYLVKTLMEKYGGHIDFESVYGEGSRFWITMPRIGSDQTTTADQSIQFKPRVLDPNEIETGELRDNIDDVLEEEPGDTAPLSPPRLPVTRPLDSKNKGDKSRPSN